MADLRNVTRIACSPGNADANDYLLGMANGLILALAILDDKEPEYIENERNEASRPRVEAEGCRKPHRKLDFPVCDPSDSVYCYCRDVGLL